MTERIAFIGGGNMASAIIGGLIQQGRAAASFDVVEPGAEARQSLRSQFGVIAHEQAGDFLQGADLVVWAVKPQVFRAATLPVRPWVGPALHLSVAAGIRCASLAAWSGSARIVRAMPNTPALVGLGMTGLYATPSVSGDDRALAEAVLALTGEFLWVEDEALLDAVTADNYYYVVTDLKQAVNQAAYYTSGYYSSTYGKRAWDAYVACGYPTAAGTGNTELVANVKGMLIDAGRYVKGTIKYTLDRYGQWTNRY